MLAHGFSIDMMVEMIKAGLAVGGIGFGAGSKAGAGGGLG
jgi:hypothetical protein